VKRQLKKHLNIRNLAIALVVIVIGVLLAKYVNIDKLIETGGVIGISLVIFAETGLLIGFFLPGDTLLFAAGFFASQGKISLAWALVGMFLGAVIGNLVGYEIGRRTGPKLFNKDENLLFNKENVTRTQHFFDKYGPLTIILARFVPVVRTLTPLVAGVGGMNYKKFVTYNIIGAALWVPSITFIGYWAGKVLGKYINIDHYILPVILLATLLTFAISFWHLWREPKSQAHIKKSVRNFFKD
jgi:membrane-associated protein